MADRAEILSLPPLGEFDLTALAAAIAGDRRYADISRALKVVEANLLVRLDLRAALDAVNQIAAIAPAPGAAEPKAKDPGSAIIGQALLNNAVILYCRAMHTQSAGGRFSTGGDKAYSPDQRRLHKQVAGLRDLRRAAATCNRLW
jgi:hypothetical protein